MSGEDACAVYCIINVDTGQKYIGSSNRALRRRREHFGALSRGKHKNEHMQNSWNKYGADAFTFCILDCCDEDDLFDVEARYIKSMRTCDRALGFNKMEDSRPSCRKFSAETRKKMSDAKKGKMPSDNSIKALRAAVNGRKQSPEHIKRRFDSRRRNGKMTNSPESYQRAAEKLRGMRHSDESKRRMSLGTQKLSERDVRDICRLRVNSMPVRAIAALASINKSTYTEMMRGRKGYLDAPSVLRDECDYKLEMALKRARTEYPSTIGDA